MGMVPPTLGAAEVISWDRVIVRGQGDPLLKGLFRWIAKSLAVLDVWMRGLVLGGVQQWVVVVRGAP